jgi:hypothetical protein
MTVPVATVEFVYVARLLEETVPMNIEQFGQLVLPTVSPCRILLLSFSWSMSHSIAFLLFRTGYLPVKHDAIALQTRIHYYPIVRQVALKGL